MTPNKQALGAAELTLPAAAPQVRITAGAGTAGQKTWNLRRPVTLFGSRRPAHIVLHDKAICKAHCVILHTGSAILLKDLHTTAGTTRNNERIDMVRLRDGDVIGIGSMRIQVAIHKPEGLSADAPSGNEVGTAPVFPAPVQVFLEHTETQWTIYESVAMIGRHPASTIRLPHDAISARHAIIFPFQNMPAVYDLGSRSGVVVNGSRCAIASLKEREHVGIGPCTLRVHVLGGTIRAVPPTDQAPKRTDAAPAPTASASLPGTTEPERSMAGELRKPYSTNSVPTDESDSASAKDKNDPETKLAETEQHLDDLEENIAESWERLNNWRERIQGKTDQFDGSRPDLGTLRAELDRKEAALRGLLHDLTRYHQQISAREKELATMLDGIANEQNKLTKARLECVERTGTLAESERKLKRGENALAQRWARLNGITCSHCGKPVRASRLDPVDSLS